MSFLFVKTSYRRRKLHDFFSDSFKLSVSVEIETHLSIFQISKKEGSKRS